MITILLGVMLGIDCMLVEPGTVGKRATLTTTMTLLYYRKYNNILN